MRTLQNILTIVGSGVYLATFKWMEEVYDLAEKQGVQIAGTLLMYTFGIAFLVFGLLGTLLVIAIAGPLDLGIAYLILLGLTLITLWPSFWMAKGALSSAGYID